MSGAIISDDLLLLTPDTFSSYATACYFEGLAADHGDGSYDITASCSHEGEEGSTKDRIHVVDRGAAGLFIRFEGLEDWGPMQPCPGTETLFPGKGIPV